MSDEMKEIMGAPIKITIGEKEYTVEKLTMERQFEVFDLVMGGFANGEGSMMQKTGKVSLLVVANVLGVPVEEINGTAAQVMQAFDKIWEQNEFGPLFRAAEQINKKVLG